MHLIANSLDDLLLKVYRRLLKKRDVVEPTKGENLEEFGNLLRLRNPHARLSRTETKGTVFSCLGEFIWYMAGSNSLDFIKYYLSRYDEFSDDGVSIHGAYGPRLFDMRGINQIDYVVEKLRQNDASRKAVVQLFDAEDVVEEHKDVPCTCTLQFVARRGKLHMMANMRSNDAFVGLPHDIFSFTMLQEVLARTLELELGEYQHAVGSLHLYTRDQLRVEKFISEGLQDDVPMPAMPKGDPWPQMRTVLKLEEELRTSKKLILIPKGLDPYWADLIRLLLIFRSSNARDIVRIKNEMHSPAYESFIRKRQASKATTPSLPLLDFMRVI